MNEPLIETLRLAQRLGFFGDRPIEEAVAHSQAFVDALGDLPASTRMIDLGSGGGLPGLVLATAYPECNVTLVDRRAKRTDFLARAVLRLGLTNTVVVAADTKTIAEQVARGGSPFDVATARGFGPPEVTVRMARELVGPGGRIVISEPPDGDRWSSELLGSMNLERIHHGTVAVFTVSS